ncbi:MAG: PfkB family carbohydrate kinase [Marinovum sp.]|nr:PfkB family carbohydrate kinase [Marinovum sp.]
MTQILCIGSVLWDVIGRTASSMSLGADVPGRITQIPGGVALNVAMTLRRYGMTPSLLSAVGRDRAGDALVAEVAEMGLGTEYLYRSEDLPTDRYMAIEGGSGLVAAIADAHSLEAANDKILRPLHNGELGDAQHPFEGRIVLDGNLTESLLTKIASDPAFGRCDLRVAPASPGKAQRLNPFVMAEARTCKATLYVNLEEAGYLCHQTFTTAQDAAAALVARGASRALVTNGGETAADADTDGHFEAAPPQVLVTRVTGAGDTFMAAHIAVESQGVAREEALAQALAAAARYVSGDTPL